MMNFANFLRTSIAPKQSHKNALDWMQTAQNYFVPMKMEATASPLLKYIYLNSAGAAEMEKFVETCRKNFLVYIVTIEMDLDNPSASCSYVQEDDSKMADQDNVSVNTETKTHIDSQSESSSYRPHSKKRRTGVKEKQKPNMKIVRFFKKILPSRSSKSKDNASSLDEMVLRDFNYSDDNPITKENMMNIEGQGKNTMQYVVPLSYIEHTIGECTNAETMREINALSSQIDESEYSIRDMLIKYITDKSIAKELLNAVTNHQHLLGDIEKRSNDLSNEHWMQQVENFKDQQKALQSSMNSIVHQNRELLEENEILSKKNEKLSAALVFLQESCANVPEKNKTSSKSILDDLSRNNDRLRYKVKSILSQVGSMEDTVKKFQKRCQFLQQQLNSSNCQLHNTKVLSEKTKTEYEVHLAKLTHELTSVTNVIKDSAEQGTIIMQDLEMLKMQLQPIAKSINWDKFEKCSKPLPELMHLNRTCINELSSALIYKQKELNMASSEIETLKLSNSSLDPLKENLQELRFKLDAAIKNEKLSKEEVELGKEQITVAETKIKSITAEMSDKDDEIKAKLNMIRERDEEITNLGELILNAKTEYNQLQFCADKLRHENNALHIQVKGMAQVLTATGAGDIAKELANSQEKLTAVQTQFFALAAENNIMLKQIETNKNERQTLVAYQKNCYEQLQTLHKTIEDVEKTNETLKEQLETEKQTVNALQTERVRHLEERTILTAIYERLKSEISKVDQLEGAVTTMNKKASKLAMIAEYNKQLGEKLQIEVAEKDEAINELQNNVKQLNSFQMESTKEKVALCEELNKVFSVKEVLNTKLTAELEKNVILDESKKEIQNSANLQLKEIQAAYNREHAALKNLVEDVKQLVAERDSLVQSKKESESKCLNVMLEHDKLVKFIKSLQEEYKEKEDKICELEQQLEKQSNECVALQKTNESEASYLRNKFEMSMDQVDSLKSENEALKGSLEYLQNDISKIRTDLEHARQKEIEYKNELEELQNTYNELYEEYRVKIATLQQIIADNDALKMNVYTLGEKFKCLTEENERISQDSVRLETMLTEKFQTSKIAGLPTPTHVENVLDDINARDAEILDLQDRLRGHEERSMELNDLLQTISQNRNTLEVKGQQLKQELDNTVHELRTQRQRGDELVGIIEELEQSTVSIEVYEGQQARFDSSFKGLKNEYDSKCQTLEHSLCNLQEQKEQLNDELKETTGNLEQYKEAHDKLQKAHKVLALKLFTAVRVLICEKVALETSQSKIKSLEHEKQRVVKDNAQNQEELDNARRQLNEFQRELDETKCENSAMFEEITATRVLLSELENKVSKSSGKNDITGEIIQEQEKCITSLKNQLDESRNTADNLQVIIANLEATSASLEFEKSEVDLRLHELQMQIQSEVGRNNEMKNMVQRTLSLIIEMKEHGRIAPHVHNQLLQSFSEVRV